MVRLVTTAVRTVERVFVAGDVGAGRSPGCSAFAVRTSGRMAALPRRGCSCARDRKRKKRKKERKETQRRSQRSQSLKAPRART